MKPFQSVRVLIENVKRFADAHSAVPLAAAVHEYGEMMMGANDVEDWLKRIDVDPLHTIDSILSQIDAERANGKPKPSVSIDPDRLLANHKTNLDLVIMINAALHETKDDDPSFQGAAVRLLDQAAVQLSRFNFLIDDLQEVNGEPFHITLDRPEQKYKGEQYDLFVRWLKDWKKDHEVNDYHNADQLQQVIGLIRDSDDKYKTAIAQHKALVEDTLTYLRACVLVAEGVGKGGTHHIKEIRLESLIEQIETVIDKLREGQRNLRDRWWYSAPDLYRNEYPVLEYIRRAQKAEQEADALRAKYEPKPKEETTQDEPDYQF